MIRFFQSWQYDKCHKKLKQDDKSDKKMKNNSIYQSNLLRPPIKCHICKCLSRIGNPV